MFQSDHIVIWMRLLKSRDVEDMMQRRMMQYCDVASYISLPLEQNVLSFSSYPYLYSEFTPFSVMIQRFTRYAITSNISLQYLSCDFVIRNDHLFEAQAWSYKRFIRSWYKTLSWCLTDKRKGHNQWELGLIESRFGFKHFSQLSCLTAITSRYAVLNYCWTSMSQYSFL